MRPAHFSKFVHILGDVYGEPAGVVIVLWRRPERAAVGAAAVLVAGKCGRGERQRNGGSKQIFHGQQATVVEVAKVRYPSPLLSRCGFQRR